MARRKPRNPKPVAPDSVPGATSGDAPEPAVETGAATHAATLPKPEAQRDQRLTIAFGLVAAVLGVVYAPGVGHPYPLVPAAGSLALIIAGLLTAAGPLLPCASRAVAACKGAAPWLATLLAVLALSGLFGRHAPLFRPIDGAHTAFFGVATEWVFIAMALTLRTPNAGSRPSAARLIHAATLALGLFVLIAPDLTIGTNHWVLQGVSDFARAPFLLLSVALTALGFAKLILPSASQPTSGVYRATTLAARWGAPALAAALVFGGALTGDIFGGLFGGVAVLLAGHHAVTLQLDPTPEATLPTNPAPALEWLGLLAVIGIWFLLKTHGLVAGNNDDNIYYYMANSLGDGLLPYSDYFFAHPPLHALVPGVIFSIFGFSIEFAKLIPLTACAIAGLAIYASVRRSFPPLVALIGLILFLFASEVLKASSNMNGVLLTVMWLALGIHAALAGTPKRAGVLLAFAPSTGFYAIAPVLAVLALGWFRPRASATDDAPGRLDIRFALTQTLSFVIVFGGIQILFYALAGEAYLDGVYRYHGEKTFQDPGMVELFGGTPGFPRSVLHNLGLVLNGKAFGKELFAQGHLWLGALVLPAMAALALVQAHGLKKGLLRLIDPRRVHAATPTGRSLYLWLIALALLVEFAMFRELYSFYFALIYPFLAALTAASAGLAVLIIARAELRRPHFPLLAMAFIAIPLAQVHLSDASLAWFSGELTDTGSRNRYDYTPPPILAVASPIVRDFFWSDFRIHGDVDPGYAQYLWNKKRTFDSLEAIATYIRERSNPEDTIAGASTIAPLIAMMADRRLAANEADTNNKRFRTGMLTEEDYWESICRDHVRFIVGAGRSHFTRASLAQNPIIQNDFKGPEVFLDHGINFGGPMEILIFEAKAAPGVERTCGGAATASPAAP